MKSDEPGFGYTAVGQIVAPQGRTGEVRVAPLTDFPERFRDLRRVYIPGGPAEKAGTDDLHQAGVQNVWFHKQFVIVKLEGVDTIETAETLRGRYLLIPDSERVDLPEGRYFISDIVGLEVFLDSGEVLGRVVDVLQPGGNDVYAVKGEGGYRQKGEILLPAIRDVIREIDLEGRRMVVTLMPGILDED
ncbi:MAG: ribosome maturation factor RimM [Firmicutes bacterium]|nr:ribosome maturation factor RimM [Bacillota bacterium]